MSNYLIAFHAAGAAILAALALISLIKRDWQSCGVAALGSATCLTWYLIG